MKNIFSWVIVVGFLAILAFLVGEKGIPDKKPPVSALELASDTAKQDSTAKYIKIGGKTLKVEVAFTPEEKGKGLSGKSELKEDEAMLFIFETPGIYAFWMKDMLFPIDIIWLTPSESGDEEEWQVVYIKENARPESYPEVFTPLKEARYVLETVSGFSTQNNLKEGDKALFLP